MNARFSEPDEAFRADVRALLAEFRDLDGYFRMGTNWSRVTAFFRALGARGWLSLGSPSREYILWDEAAYARTARAPLDAGIVAKSIARYGDDAQRRAWLPRIHRGECWFSLGYSEPEAGSDLAALRTRAERDGDAYVLRGEKCWTSYAEHTDWLWTLARTGAADSRGRGLSLFIIDLHEPGVCVEPLPLLDGEQLNAIRLDGVRVPLARRIGPENGAWKIIGEALADERHVQFPPGRLRRDLEEVVAFLRASGRGADPVVQPRDRRSRGARAGVRDARATRARRGAARSRGHWGGGGQQGRAHRHGPGDRARRRSTSVDPKRACSAPAPSSCGARASGNRSAAAPARSCAASSRSTRSGWADGDERPRLSYAAAATSAARKASISSMRASASRQPMSTSVFRYAESKSR